MDTAISTPQSMADKDHHNSVRRFGDRNDYDILMSRVDRTLHIYPHKCGRRKVFGCIETGMANGDGLPDIDHSNLNEKH